MGILKVLNEKQIPTLLSICNRIKHCEVYTGVSFFFLCMLWSLSLYVIETLPEK